MSRTRPHGRSLGRPLEPLGPELEIFQGTLSGPRHPLWPRERPRLPLTPAGHLHSAISSPLPPWGWDTWGQLGATGLSGENPQTPPSRPPHCEDPPVLPSVKGTPFMREGTVTAGTSVPHISYPLLYEGIGGLLSLVSAKGIHLQRTWAWASRTRPQGRSQERQHEPLRPGLRIFPGAFLRPKRRLPPGECPRCPSTPAGPLHPTI